LRMKKLCCIPLRSKSPVTSLMSSQAASDKLLHGGCSSDLYVSLHSVRHHNILSYVSLPTLADCEPNLLTMHTFAQLCLDVLSLLLTTSRRAKPRSPPCWLRI
jgi:hypothetical protein